jgi:nicotinamide-nucleotide amidase
VPIPAEQLVAALRARNLTLATAESLTGGALASEIVGVPGASAVFVGGVVAYATRVKAEALGVDAGLLAAEGAIHPTVAEQMAAGVRQRMAADVGVATTGAAGPDPQDGHPPGEVWLGIATASGVRSVRLDLAGDRAAIRRATVERALAEALAAVAE